MISKVQQPVLESSITKKVSLNSIRLNSFISVYQLNTSEIDANSGKLFSENSSEGYCFNEELEKALKSIGKKHIKIQNLNQVVLMGNAHVEHMKNYHFTDLFYQDGQIKDKEVAAFMKKTVIGQLKSPYTFVENLSQEQMEGLSFYFLDYGSHSVYEGFNTSKELRPVSAALSVDYIEGRFNNENYNLKEIAQILFDSPFTDLKKNYDKPLDCIESIPYYNATSSCNKSIVHFMLNLPQEVYEKAFEQYCGKATLEISKNGWYEIKTEKSYNVRSNYLDYVRKIDFLKVESHKKSKVEEDY